MGTTNILHLSDLHIGNGELPCRGEISSVVNARSIDMIIFTGDIFDSKRKQEDKGWMDDNTKIKKALDFFNQLSEDLGVSKENILFVPGNHDYNREKKEFTDIWHNYDTFLEQFYEKEKEFYSQCYLVNRSNHMVIKDDKERKILYLGFNSNFIDEDCLNDEKKGGKTLIDVLQTNKLKDFENQNYEDYYKIAFFHHPSYLFRESKDVVDGVLSNGADFMQLMIRFGVKLFLHGHKHYGRSEINIQHGAQIYMIAAGSIGKADNMNRSFNKISIEDNETVKLIEMKSNNSSYFEPDFIPLAVPMQKGLLIDLLCSMEEPKRLYPDSYKKLDSDVKNVIQLINQMYLEYDPLIVLSRGRNTECNIFIDILLFSIQYRIWVREYMYQVRNSYTIERLNHSYAGKISKFKERIESEKIKAVFEKVLEVLGTGKKIYVNKMLKDELEEDLEKKKYVSYALLAAFFTDLYLDFSKYSKDRMKEFGIVDKNGVERCWQMNLDTEPIEYDVIHKKMYVRIDCSDIEEKRCAASLMREYRERCFELDNYFSCIRIYIKRIDPEFTNDDGMSYDTYDAHIPRLINLLTGKNIYESDLVFARELIQNAIDAISFREKRENSSLKKENKKILIEIVNNDKMHYFKITDSGIGMGKEIIRRYFTTLGRSYYKEYDYIENKKLEYNSISNFGVGFLSVFRPCKEIIIQTKPFDEEVCYQLNIESGNDYFFLKTDENLTMPAGTNITCHFKSEAAINDEELCRYIKEIMLDIKYPIHISVKGKRPQEIDIAARDIREKTGENVIYIPFDEDEKQVVYYKREKKEAFKEQFQDGTFRHGILIQRSEQEKSRLLVLNAGILMKNTHLENLFLPTQGKLLQDLQYHDIIMNFPPGWLEIDMSREKVNRIKEKYNEPSFMNSIYTNFKKQLREYKNSVHNISLAEVLELENFMKQLFEKEEIYTGIKLDVSIGQGRINFELDEYEKGDEKESDLKIIYNYGFEENINREKHKILQKRLEERLKDSDFWNIFAEADEKISEFLFTIGISELKELKYFPVVLAAYLPENVENIKNENMRKNVRGLKKRILEKCTFEDLKRETLLSVHYDSKDEARVNATEVKLQEIIETIAGQKGINRYDYIWEQSIYKFCSEYFDIAEKNLENIKEYGQPLYEQSRDSIKDLYLAASEGRESLIDCCMIASCYTKALLQTPNEYIDKPRGTDNKLNKYQWILKSALKIIYIWKLSECIKNGNKEKDEKLRQHDNLEMPEGRYDSYIKILALHDTYQEKFDLLSFAELLKWVADYNDEIQ